MDIENIEVGAHNTFIIFAHSEMRQEGEGVLERARGCNGREHVDTFALVFYDEEGEVDGALSRGEQRVGACDHSCGDIAQEGYKPEEHGAFLYPLPGEGRDYRTHGGQRSWT